MNEEELVMELDEHRAVMRYANEHIFIFCKELDEWVREGEITDRARMRIIASLGTVMKSIAEKLQDE